MLYKPVEYMKKYIVCVTVVMLIMLCGCNKQKATDIVIDNSSIHRQQKLTIRTKTSNQKAQQKIHLQVWKQMQLNIMVVCINVMTV